MRSEALKRAQKRYQERLQKTGKLPQKTFLLSCHTKHDADIISVLEEQENVNGYIKDLIRADMKKQG